MRLAAALLALVLALPARADDAGVQFVEATSAVVLTPSGAFVAVDGGAWLADAAIDRLYAEQARLAAENAVLKTTPPPTPVGVVVALVVGLVGGAALATWAWTATHPAVP